MTLPRKTNEPLDQAADDPLPEIGREAGCPIGLALAVFLDLLVGVVSVKLDDPLAAADLGHELVGFGDRLASR